jgi:hypothetical protein
MKLAGMGTDNEIAQMLLLTRPACFTTQHRGWEGKRMFFKIITQSINVLPNAFPVALYI